MQQCIYVWCVEVRRKSVQAPSCATAMHTSCAGLSSIPQGKWLCPMHSTLQGQDKPRSKVRAPKATQPQVPTGSSAEGVVKKKRKVQSASMKDAGSGKSKLEADLTGADGVAQRLRQTDQRTKHENADQAPAGQSAANGKIAEHHEDEAVLTESTRKVKRRAMIGNAGKRRRRPLEARVIEKSARAAKTQSTKGAGAGAPLSLKLKLKKPKLDSSG